MTALLTLAAIRKHYPCRYGWEKLLGHLGKTAADDEPLSLLTILDRNGLNDALWCLRALPVECEAAVRLLVCDLVEPALQYTTDPLPAETLRVARAYARGEATAAQLTAARDAAWAAAEDAAWAAEAAAESAAWAAAWAAAEDAARDAAWAAEAAAESAARDAARAAHDAARDEQEAKFRAWIVTI